MSEKTRIPLDEAEALSAEVVKMLSDCCEHIEVLGSIRRRKPTVGDIEIGCIPLTQEGEPVNLFGDPGPSVNLQFQLIQQKIEKGVFQHRRDVNGRPACGERFQRLVYRGAPVDIFCCLPPAQWGVIKLIRTGSGDFNKRIVLPSWQGGTVLPCGMKFQDGALWREGKMLGTPEEEDVFAAIGLDYIGPWERVA